jgi:hypothetical protein
MRRFSLCSSVAALAAFLTAASVQAQTPADSTSPPPAGNTASATFHSASSSRGQGIGVGAMTMLNGASGILGTWGAGGYHVDGFLGLHHYKPGGDNGSSTTDISFGARGWYHLHAASFADFSLGGGIGFSRWVENPGVRNQENSHFDVSVEVGGQIRAFIVPNVALMGDMGFGMIFGSNDNILFGAQSWGGGGDRGLVQGSLGIAYFFE